MLNNRPLLAFHAGLEQSTAVWPFMRHFGMLLEVTCRTGKDGVGHIMPWVKLCSRYRDCMIKMVDVLALAFLKLGKTVVTRILLFSQFVQDLLRRERSFYALLARPSFLCTSMIQFFVCLVIFPCLRPSLISMTLIMPYAFLIGFISMGLSIALAVLVHLFLMGLVVFFVLLIQALFIFLVVRF